MLDFFGRGLTCLNFEEYTFFYINFSSYLYFMEMVLGVLMMQ